MELSKLREIVDEFEGILNRAFQGKYSQEPKEFRDSLFEFSVVLRWNLVQFLEAYLSGQRYPQERLDTVMFHLFDVKLQLYYIHEVDLGLYNRIVFTGGYDDDNPLTRPHLLLTRFSFDQSLIGKSRVLWERIMNFVFHLETGDQLENRVSGNKSKQRVFFEFVDSNPHWRFLQPYREELLAYDAAFRTPEFHKSSVLRAELLGRRQIDPNELITLVNRANTAIWENIIAIVSGDKPRHFTDLHLDRDGSIDKRYLD